MACTSYGRRDPSRTHTLNTGGFLLSLSLPPLSLCVFLSVSLHTHNQIHLPTPPLYRAQQPQCKGKTNTDVLETIYSVSSACGLVCMHTHSLISIPPPPLPTPPPLVYYYKAISLLCFYLRLWCTVPLSPLADYTHSHGCGRYPWPL